MTSDSYHIRAMTHGELDIAIAWANAEGWNPGLHDADCFYNTDPTGFLMGFLNDQPIATISAIKYGESFGFIGFYIVKPDVRGQGYGLAIWQAALAHLQGRNIGLDGVVAQQDNYIKSGFHLAHRNIRYEGVGQGQAQGQAPESGCIPLARIPLEQVVEYDHRFFPGERPGFTQGWIAQPHSHAVGVMQAQTLVGYGGLRPGHSGFKIGPLFADTAAIAHDIFQTLVAQVPAGRPFCLDVPQVNGEAVALAENYGMNAVFETARDVHPREARVAVTSDFWHHHV